MAESRRPLRPIALAFSAAGAAATWAVSSGLLDVGQGDAVTGLIAAVVTVLATWGVPVFGEPAVTPVSDPRNDHGRPLVPVEKTWGGSET